MWWCDECDHPVTPTRVTKWEKIDGENWEEQSELRCPYCGNTEIYEPSEYDLEVE